MKRSRIICSSIIVLSILMSIFLVIILSKSSLENNNSLNINIKLIHVSLVAVCTGLYVLFKRKLINKVNSNKLINIYCYLYLVVLVFVSRFVMSYVLKVSPETINPGYINGVGSYINYWLGKILKSYSYSNIIINTILVYASSVIIKRIMLNITKNDFVSTITSILYIFIPKALTHVKEYLRWEYNIIVMLLGIYIIVKIIDLVKDFDNKNRKYIYYSIMLGLIISLDIILGGSYIFWMMVLIVTAFSANYVDITHIEVSERIKKKLDYKKKILVEKIERINISKLVYVCLISLLIPLIFVIINSLVNGVNNYEMRNIFKGLLLNLKYARNYYIVIIIFTIVFDILGLILKRDIDIKMIILKTCFVSSLVLIPFINSTIYSTYIFDTFLVINVIISLCNVCINREERIKLLKEKN